MGDLFYAFMVLSFLATVQTIALEIVFENQLYQVLFGRGMNGEGSKFLNPWDIRPYVSIAAGVFIAFAFQVQLIHLGVPSLEANPNFIGKYGSQADMIFTGLLISGGTKKVKEFFNSIQQSAKDAKETAAAVKEG